MIRHFALALSFLTILRLPFVSRDTADSLDLARSFYWFPLVGLVLGGCWLLAALLLHALMPPLLLSVLLTTLMALLTRGLHLDGLADLADGVGGGFTPERRLQIMKDSCVGSFGALALILGIACKVAALSALLPGRSWWPELVLIPTLSRLAMVLGAYKSTYARLEGGLGKPFCEHIQPAHVAAASASTLVAGLVLAPLMSAILLPVLLACVLLVRRLTRRWLGGITGDVLGALNEITEAALLTIAACLHHCQSLTGW
jgi:adenosylcobinamide-GDP ribazoletransferase